VTASSLSPHLSKVDVYESNIKARRSSEKKAKQVVMVA